MAKKVKKAAKSSKSSVKSTTKTASKATKPTSKQKAPKVEAKVKPLKVAKTGEIKVPKKVDKKVETPAALKVEAKKIADKKPVVESKISKKAAKKKDEFDDIDDFELEEAVLTENFKNKSQAEIEEIRALLGEVGVEDSDEVEIALRDAEGRLYCKVRECDELSVVDGYCRLHYLKFWKRIQLRKKILTDGKLEKYIDELTQRYPDKYIDMLREDLKSEKSFLSAINELEIEEANEEADNMDDDQQGLIDEVRGIQPTGTAADDDDGF